MFKKKKLSVIVSALLVLSLFLVACGSGDADDGDTQTVGISMPTQALERWEIDGSNMVESLEELGYETEIQYAQNETQTQISNIENMITNGVDALIIAPINGEALTGPVNLAAEQDIPVISYDRLIMNTENVDYYTTFDLLNVGELQGEYIVDALNLEEEEGPFNIELFGGAPDDNNAPLYFEGAMSKLQPYIDDGTLVVQSGQTDFNTIAIENWDNATAQTRMDNLLTSSYTNEVLDAVLTPNDAVAQGVVSSLTSMGYGSEDMPYPVTTGQDAETASVQSIIDGEQTMTVYKDTRALADSAIEMVSQILAGEEPETNNTYDNGSKDVSTMQLEPIPVDADNYQEVLIDSGYFSEDDFN